MTITNTWLKATNGKTQDKAFMVADRDNMYARVTAKGAISFVFRYKFEGKADQLRLGTYPVLTLDKARDKALDYKRLLADGKNPRIIRDLAKVGQAKQVSFKDMFDNWFNRECEGVVKDSRKTYLKFEKDIFPTLGHLPAEDIGVGIWMSKLEEIKDRAPSVAAVLLTNTKKAYGYAAKRESVKTNPLRDISVSEDLRVEQKRRDEMLGDDEVKAVLKAIEHPKFNRRNALFVKLCLITGCRPNELRLAKKSDFDFVSGVWTIPASNHKTGIKSGKDLKRPIVEGMVDILKELMSLSESELLLVNDKTGEQLKDSFWTTIPKRINRYADIEMPEWNIYYLRKTMRTNMSKLTQPWIAEIMIGHSLGKVFGIYDQHSYLDEQAEAYTKWVNKLEEME